VKLQKKSKQVMENC